MRKKSTLEAGDYGRPYAPDAHSFYPKQEVQILREVVGGEDMFAVRLEGNAREILVPGDALDPHPDLPETNIEFAVRLMDMSRAGALMQAFVITAIEKYAEQVNAMPQDQRDRMDSTMLPYAPWERCASEALVLLKERGL